jgi:glycosyltransferase involved in cell wall biosynthesis
MTTPHRPIRLVRVIARLNIGGPAIQAITLTRLLEPRGYTTRLVRGTEGDDEGSMDYLAAELGVSPTLIKSIRRDPGPGDFEALGRLAWIVRRDRPQIVHTHTAKAGTLGRVATLLAFPLASRRPVLIHMFHGHSLTGYFDSHTARLFLEIERWLARRTDALVAVSEEVRNDLIRLGVAEPERFSVIPLGFDLGRFTDDAGRFERRAAVREQWRIAPEAEVVTLIARLVPIKRVDRFLRIAARLAQRPGVRFVIVGDGELRDQLAVSNEARGLGDRLVWAGFRCDMPDVCFASDLVVLTSDNEGTPVSLIEAQAAAVPVIGTDVGGVRSAVLDGRTGLVVEMQDEPGFARAVETVLGDPALAQQMARSGREHASASFSVQRLVDDVDNLYRSLLSSN